MNHGLKTLWSRTYDEFSDMKVKDFFELSGASGYRFSGSPGEDYDYSEIADFQNKLKKVCDTLNGTEKS